MASQALEKYRIQGEPAKTIYLLLPKSLQVVGDNFVSKTADTILCSMQPKEYDQKKYSCLFETILGMFPLTGDRAKMIYEILPEQLATKGPNSIYKNGSAVICGTDLKSGVISEFYCTLQDQ